MDCPGQSVEDWWYSHSQTIRPGAKDSVDCHGRWESPSVGYKTRRRKHAHCAPASPLERLSGVRQDVDEA